MAFEQDYILRVIKDSIRAISVLLLGKKELEIDWQVENEVTAGSSFYHRLTELADTGKINEAENLLYQELDVRDLSYAEAGLAFYQYINEMEDSYLEECRYSREEIGDGVVLLAKKFGITGMEL